MSTATWALAFVTYLVCWLAVGMEALAIIYGLQIMKGWLVALTTGLLAIPLAYFVEANPDVGALLRLSGFAAIVPPLVGDSVPPWVPIALGGLVGALLVFALTNLLMLVRERRDFRAAVVVVLDELQSNCDTCAVRLAEDQIRTLDEELTIAELLGADRFESVQLLLARRLPRELRQSVTGAYRAFRTAEAHVTLKAVEAKGVLASLEKTIGDAERELRSYSDNLEKWESWFRTCQRVPYISGQSSGEGPIPNQGKLDG
ncbi:MAG TPA: hypothetical protein VF383_01265 [Candidatus Dormibacteraeota bacterium]